MRLCTALLLGVVACGPSHSPRYDPIPLDRPRADNLDNRTALERDLDAFVGNIGEHWGPAHQFSGYVHAVRGSSVLYSRAFGYADRETMRPNTVDTSFRIGSVTKQFTAAAILILEQQGVLSTEDTVAKHLPKYPGEGAKVTIHQLLTHTSGIPSYTGFPLLMATRDKPRTVAEVVATFSNKPLEFRPGEKFAYSNSGYFLLGAIIEAATGTTYAKFLKEKLFDPAKLDNTAVGDVGNNRALGYAIGADDTLELAHAIDMSLPFSAGAIRSTASDLVRWHRALQAGDILTAESRRKLARVEPVTGKARYAYGWSVREAHGKTVVEHGGGIDGFSTQYTRIPEDDLVVIVWSNNPAVRVAAIAGAAVAGALDKPIEPNAEPKPTKLDGSVAARLAGAYELSDDGRKAALAAGLPETLVGDIATIELSRVTGGLKLSPKGQPAATLRPVEGGSFYNHASKVRVVPSFAEDGSVSRLRLSQGALSLEYVPQ